MRIAILSRYNGEVTRGVESWCINLCRHLEQRGHTCLLIQGGSDLPANAAFHVKALGLKRHAESWWLRHSRISGLVSRCYLDAVNRDVAEFSLKAVPHLLAFRPDVIIPASNLWTLIAAKVAGWWLKGHPRIVITSQAGWSYFERDDLRLGIDGFSAIQPAIYDEAMRFERGRTPVVLIPNGVEVDRFRTGPCKSVPLSPPIAIVVSALDDYKRVDLAVRAVAQAGLSLLLLGDGPNSAEVDGLAQVLLGRERYLRLPSVSHDEVASYYRAADVFSLSSTGGEAFGIVIIEALAAGLPVVVNDDPVRRWIAGDAGYFIDAIDTKAYARALQTAAATPRNTDETHLAQFEWSTVADQYETFLKELCATRRRIVPRALALPVLLYRIALRYAEFAHASMHKR